MRDFFLLTRIRLSAAIAGTSLLGSLLADSSWTPALLASLGVLFLAGGASALNQVQERDLDARMARTRQRPLPAGRLRPGAALLMSGLLLLGGGGILSLAGPGCLLLGVAAVLLYNGLYTLLKPRSLFALLPGALAGALPPLIGWCATGGRIQDPRILLPAACLFLWQVPHFWLLARRCRQDLAAAGLPYPDRLGSRHADRILCVWVLALAFGAFATLTAHPHPSAFGLAGGAFLLLYLGAAALRPTAAANRLPLTMNSAMLGLAFLLVFRSWYG